MLNGKPFAMFFNASPRKGWNTHKMLDAARAGAEEAGAETELVNLYDIKFPGCRSCFACKLKNAKTNGVCAIRDDLRPILERARQADVLVLGSPIYFGYPTGVYRAFLERLAFPVYSYHYEDGQPLVCRDKVVETASIFTMNIPESGWTSGSIRRFSNQTHRRLRRCSARRNRSTPATHTSSPTTLAMTSRFLTRRPSEPIVTRSATSISPTPALWAKGSSRMQRSAFRSLYCTAELWYTIKR